MYDTWRTLSVTQCATCQHRFSQLKLKVGAMWTHDMMSLGGKVKVVGLSG